MIPYGSQTIDDTDIASVVEVLKSSWLTQGPNPQRFEESVCKYTDADYAVSVNSATSALHIACIALDVGLGDEVWTSARNDRQSYCDGNNFLWDLHANWTFDASFRAR